MNLRDVISGRLKSALHRFAPGLRISRADGFDPLEIDDLVARCDCVWPENERFIAAWRQLLQAAPGGTAFQSPLWQEAIVAQFIAPDALRLISVWRGQQMLAVLPLHYTTRCELQTPGWEASDYLEPLVDPSATEPAWRMILGLLRRLWDRDVADLVLENISADSSLRTVLPGIAAEEGFEVEQSAPTPELSEQQISDRTVVRVDLPDNWAAYEQVLRDGGHHEMLRKLRKAESRGGARLVICDQPEAAPAILESALRMLEAQGGDKGQLIHDMVRPLLERVSVPLVREGLMRIYTLEIENAPAAHLIVFPSRRGPLLYNGAYDEAKRWWSPGTVIYAMSIRHSIEQRHPVFDMLRGREPYKYTLGASDHPLYRLRLHPRP